MARTVAYVVSTLAPLGPVNVVRNVVSHLRPENYRPVVVTLSPECGNSQIHEFRALGVPVQQLNMSRTVSFVAGPPKLKRAVELSGADIVHCHGFRADVLASSVELEIGRAHV